MSWNVTNISASYITGSDEAVVISVSRWIVNFGFIFAIIIKSNRFMPKNGILPKTNQNNAMHKKNKVFHYVFLQ